MSWNARELGLAGLGLAVLAFGAYLTVRATENIVIALGISRLIGGLFSTAIMTVFPELFATWTSEHDFEHCEIVILDSVCAIYVAITVFWVLNIVWTMAERGSSEPGLEILIFCSVESIDGG